jgi:hypothetical protein
VLEIPNGMGCGRLGLAPGGCGDRLAAHAVPHRDVVRAVLAEGAAEHVHTGGQSRSLRP